ncbi:hypothetical protein BJ322DRAFT_124692 [Thelephora terrestris]|uniref:Uncharacterized protein n=1 Tax=Thelephora terrestris TaxID=56493 RepID=A0A9P6LCG5_9AGAM|nr:hypothetical protein BJ322DRAFT_124692 [Thelephora terrestris]
MMMGPFPMGTSWVRWGPTTKPPARLTLRLRLLSRRFRYDRIQRILDNPTDNPGRGRVSLVRISIPARISHRKSTTTRSLSVPFAFACMYSILFVSYILLLKYNFLCSNAKVKLTSYHGCSLSGSVYILLFAPGTSREICGTSVDPRTNHTHWNTSRGSWTTEPHSLVVTLRWS